MDRPFRKWHYMSAKMLPKFSSPPFWQIDVMFLFDCEFYLKSMMLYLLLQSLLKDHYKNCIYIEIGELKLLHKNKIRLRGKLWD